MKSLYVALGGSFLLLFAAVLGYEVRRRVSLEAKVSLLSDEVRNSNMAVSQKIIDALKAVTDATNVYGARLTARVADLSAMNARKDERIAALTEEVQKLQDEDAIEDAEAAARVSELLQSLEAKRAEDAAEEAAITSELNNLAAQLTALSPNDAPVEVPPANQPIPSPTPVSPLPEPLAPPEEEAPAAPVGNPPIPESTGNPVGSPSPSTEPVPVPTDPNPTPDTPPEEEPAQPIAPGQPADGTPEGEAPTNGTPTNETPAEGTEGETPAETPATPADGAQGEGEGTEEGGGGAVDTDANNAGITEHAEVQNPSRSRRNR